MNSFKKLLANPQLNGWGFFLGVIGLLFAIYTYWVSQDFPNLLAQVHPARTILVSPGGAQDLTIFASGKQIKGPVTSVQIAIWNAGTKPIRAEDVLEKIRIRTNKITPIISVRMLKMTRDATGVSTDISRMTEGIIGINFKILESSDAALLQLTYEGDEKIEFIGSGIIVGQSKFELLKFTNPPSLEEKPNYHNSKYNKLTFIAGICIGCFFLFRIGTQFYRDINKAIFELRLNKGVSYKIKFAAKFLSGLIAIMFLIYVIFDTLHNFNINISPFLAE